MGRMTSIKWDRSTPCRPNHNIISSDFAKYTPHPWKFSEGREDMSYILSYEYQRLWAEERDAWAERMYPATTENIDIVKRYVLTFKNPTPPKKEKPVPFKIKKFEAVQKTLSTKRSKDDKAMNYLNKKKPK